MTLCTEEITVPDLDLLQWLKGQTTYPKIYWKERGGKKTFAALGAAQKLSQIPKFEESSPNIFFGGLSFFSNKKKDLLWKSFPACSFILPEFTLLQEKNQTSLLHHFSSKPSLSYEYDMPFVKASLQERIDIPSKEEWEKKVLFFLRKIQSKELDKIVLARRTSLSFNKELNPFEIVEKLSSYAKNATLFAFQFSKDEAFIGASPEKLYSRNGSNLTTESLAGTLPRSKNKEEDIKIKKELMSKEKERKEFSIVKEFLPSVLSSYCENLSFTKEKVLSTSNLHHLYQKLEARLKPNLNDNDLIALLHPTPALGGFPREKTMKYLLEEESFDRGWYGSPIGWISSQGADIAVGIRSALVQKNTVHLFAAVGIVEGSDPVKEWEELEHKIENFKKILL